MFIVREDLLRNETAPVIKRDPGEESLIRTLRGKDFALPTAPFTPPPPPAGGD